ncbi:phosphonate ABC transporter ATP-binding protein [Halorubrum persicum]|uniref:Phosphonate ABC transporter ATP-binding protein n=1 Tax=Halorubrum persicum TaxID=1383844 RepID=A0A2G1WHT0_9EURY|nr:ATP-binding cassette domain-containing protein [Halorubrum persicum]PHQ38558.1 phosphonate ABC transporter ATP-binding protein [Halorubrum persicum]
MLVASGLKKRYGGTSALADVSLKLQRGELAVLVGRSGAGKTTLLRCLGGLESPDTGTIEFDGAPLAQTDAAFVFQEGALVDEKSAVSNVLDGVLGRIPGWRAAVGWYPAAEKRAAVEQLHEVGLDGYGTRRVGTLSGGERQRVGIARALQQEPVVLLADEPVASLDPATGRDVLERIADVVKTRNLVGLVSLHQPRLVESFADRYLGLSAGQLVFDMPADDLSVSELMEVYDDR